MARKALAGLRRGERGFTLIELLVASSLSLVVVGGALTLFIGAIRSEPRTADKVAAIQQGRYTIDRITREIRQGIEVPIATPSELSVVTYVKSASCGGAPASTSIPCRVTYSCGDGTCARTVGPPDGSAQGQPVQLVSGLADPTVFSYVPSATDPTYIGVDLTISGDNAAGPVTLSDGVALRNPDGSL